jgi:hypothetical protein
MNSSPYNLEDLKPVNCHAEPLTEDEAVVLALHLHMERVQSRYVKLEKTDKDTGNITTLVVSGPATSRYFPAGRNAIKRSLTKRLPWQARSGVMFTVTVDPKRFTKQEAFEEIGNASTRFRKRLHAWRKRQGWRASPGYVAVKEEQKNGYPHIHFFYPGLKYLAPKEKLNQWWDMGYCHITGTMIKSASPLHYVLKYVTKLQAWSEQGLGYLYTTKTRLYNISNNLYQFTLPHLSSGWQCVSIGQHANWSNVEITTTGIRLGEEVLIEAGDGAYLGLEGYWINFKRTN